MNRGVSLLIVVLISSIMVLTVVSMSLIAKRNLQTSQSYFESLQDIYTTEDAFECVRFWLQQDEDAFEPGATTNPQCGPQAQNPSLTFVAGTNYASDANYATSTFTVFTPPGNVEVDVVRDRSDPNGWSGRIWARGYNIGDAAPRRAERLRVYEYDTGAFDFSGVDVMFVIDRSGSIEPRSVADRAAVNPGDPSEWGQLLYAVASSTWSLLEKFPQPRVGYVSTGVTPEDGIGAVGRKANDAGPGMDPNACTWAQSWGCPSGLCCANPDWNWRAPDVPLRELADVSDLLANTATVDRGDDRPKLVNTDPTDTNLSLGLAVAAAELSNGYYADAPDAGASGWISSDFESGAFEYDVADGNGLGFPPKQPAFRYGRDNNDYPNYIIIITDGEPNALIRHNNDSVTCFDSTIPTTQTGGEPGDPLVFYTPGGTGCVAYTQPVGSWIAADETYNGCNDEGWNGLNPSGGDLNNHSPTHHYPANPLGLGIEALGGVGFPTNNGLYPSMCNTTMVADALKNNLDIKIAAVGVGVSGETEQWLRDMVVTQGADGPLYVSANAYTDVPTLFQELSEKIAPSLFR